MSRKPNFEHEIFLEQLLDTIISKNLNFSEIAKILKEKGLEYNNLSKRWVNSFETEDASIEDSTEFIPSKREIIVTNDDNVMGAEPEPVNVSPLIFPETNGLNDVIPSPNNSKQIEELLEKLSKQETLSQEILLKISNIESLYKEKSEESVRKTPSNITLSFLQLLELNYSNGKRYEATLREDLVTKATERLQSRYPSLSIDLTKPSRLFEVILMDYICSIK